MWPLSVPQTENKLASSETYAQCGPPRNSPWMTHSRVATSTQPSSFHCPPCPALFLDNAHRETTVTIWKRKAKSRSLHESGDQPVQQLPPREGLLQSPNRAKTGLVQESWGGMETQLCKTCLRGWKDFVRAARFFWLLLWALFLCVFLFGWCLFVCFITLLPT